MFLQEYQFNEVIKAFYHFYIYWTGFTPVKWFLISLGRLDYQDFYVVFEISRRKEKKDNPLIVIWHIAP